MTGRRVVIVGPLVATGGRTNPTLAGLEASLRNRGHHILVSEDVRHALLLQRMFQPNVVLFPRLPKDSDMALLASSATRPIVVMADTPPEAAVGLIRQGVARVLPAAALPNQIELALGLDLAKEKPVVRAVAQLTMMKATGCLDVGVDGALGAIIFDAGAVFSVRAGTRRGNEAMTFLAAQDAPLVVAFGVESKALPDIDIAEGTSVEAVAVAINDDDDFDVDVAVSVPRAPVTSQQFFPPGALRESARLGPPRVLVVEDDFDLLELYRLLFKARGFHADVAHDGEEGFARALASPPDVILSDIMMPRASGWDLLGMVRNNARLRETPFLVFSHHEEMLRSLKLANGGADAYLEKTVRPDAVVSVVQAVIQPLRDLETELQAGAPRVEGTLFGLGAQTLLRLCLRQALTGRLAVRAQNQRFLFALDGGDVLEAQCSLGTSTLRDRDALRSFLLIDDGNFTFVRGPVSSTNPRAPLALLLDELNKELETLLEDLRSGALLTGTPLKVRRELLAVYRTTAPATVAMILDQIDAGRPPRDLIASGAVDLVLVDSVVRDLFRKGVAAP